MPWTAADVLDVLEHQHRSILDDPSCSFVDERSIAEVVGKGSKLKALVRSLNNRSRLRSALPTAAGPLRSLITSFGELPATAVDPPGTPHHFHGLISSSLRRSEQISSLRRSEQWT